MERSVARQTNVNELQELLSSKHQVVALSEAEQQVLNAGVRDVVDVQIKNNVEFFAKRIVAQQLRLMKALRKTALRQGVATSKSGQANASVLPVSLPRGMPMFGGGLPQPPSPRTASASHVPSWLSGQYLSFAPPYTSSGPFPEFDTPPSSVPFGEGLSSKVELAKIDGNICLGAALGATLGVERGADNWLFGDATIANGWISQLLQIPAAYVSGSATVSADILIKGGTRYMRVATDPGWIGILGTVILTLQTLAGPPVSFSQEFLFDWSSAEGVPTGNFWIPDFSVSGFVKLPPVGTPLLVIVTASVAVLRVSTFDDFLWNEASIEFFDSTVKGSVSSFGSFGPVQVPNLGLWLRPQ